MAWAVKTLRKYTQHVGAAIPPVDLEELRISQGNSANRKQCPQSPWNMWTKPQKQSYSHRNRCITTASGDNCGTYSSRAGVTSDYKIARLLQVYVTGGKGENAAMISQLNRSWVVTAQGKNGGNLLCTDPPMRKKSVNDAYISLSAKLVYKMAFSKEDRPLTEANQKTWQFITKSLTMISLAIPLKGPHIVNSCPRNTALRGFDGIRNRTQA